MKQIILLLLIAFSIVTQAQQADTTKLIGLHPAVGKTIDRVEKIHFKLFPEYADSLFESAQIFKTNDTAFLLVIHSVTGMEVKNPITVKQLDALYYQVDDVENPPQKTTPEYVMSPEERREERKQRNRDTVSHVFVNILGQMVLISVDVLLTIAFHN